MILNKVLDNYFLRPYCSYQKLKSKKINLKKISIKIY